ncbi:MAG TPA: FtsQ-type POTRA domain-containing protein [Candidatus Portnoybacteria bacterium]|nr:FtsQ-type POTRA domain-containing protein [Candidatus Portnoybacteria bacterium]HPH52054.1 FtsQ-type POTRA domain-containing protein [Candidatus Portnoybacteria bacterium]HPM28445.1 FtsQ-type POTRA domain-containing protein [Candidatus Portnoybacteria bacterium]
MYHHKINKIKKKSRKRVIIWIISLFVLAMIIYVLFFSPIFKIKEIIIFGNRKVSAEEIKNNLVCENIILTNNKNIRNQLLKKNLAILELKIRKNLFKRKLEINIEEREEIGIVCSVDRCFYFDKEGIVFQKAPITSGSLITIVQDYSNRNYELGNKIADKSFIDIILEITKDLFSEIGLKILSFNISSYPIKELKAITSEGWYVLFNLERNINNQLLLLKVGLKEKIKNRTNLHYVDLRIENRIYYK